MTWQPTAALMRAVIVALVGLVGGVVLGDPAPVVLAAPFALLAAMGLLRRPGETPYVVSERDHGQLHEGQATTSRLRVTGAGDAEQVTRIVAQAPYTTVSPRLVSVPVTTEGDWPEVTIRVDRWGRRRLGDERVALLSGWGGYRWGPQVLTGSLVQALPVRAEFDLDADAPQPLGLVGPHRSRRTGSGTEFNGIRPFASGDRLRRIHWRESARAGALHVITTRAEEDSGVLIVLDALADLGRSGGVGGQASSLDLAVRAASALAEQHIRLGDRVALRVLQPGGAWVPEGSERRHLRRLLETLARIEPGRSGALPGHWRWGVRGGTVVYVLSPLLVDPVVTTAVLLTRQGLPVIAVDTLPEGVRPGLPPGVDMQVADLAWRLRRVEREELVAALATAGVPVTPWGGPGSLDEVLRLLSRRAARPRLVTR